MKYEIMTWLNCGQIRTCLVLSVLLIKYGLVPYLSLLTAWRGESRKSKIEYLNFRSIFVLASASSRGWTIKCAIIGSLTVGTGQPGFRCCLRRSVAHTYLQTETERQAVCVRGDWSSATECSQDQQAVLNKLHFLPRQSWRTQCYHFLSKK